MGKQWLYLLGLAFVMMFLYFGWDVFTTVSGQRDEFSYNLLQIDENLYEGLEEHFQGDPKYQEYVQEADRIESIDYFAPPTIEEEGLDF